MITDHGASRFVPAPVYAACTRVGEVLTKAPSASTQRTLEVLLVRRPRLRPVLSTLVGTVAVTASALVVPFLPAPSASAVDPPRDGTIESRAVLLGGQAGESGGRRRPLLAADPRPAAAAAVLVRDDHGRRRVGADWPWPAGLDFTAEGQGSPATVSAPVTGTAAFAPAHLTNDLVNALLDNRAPSGLYDGLRVRRAKDAAGSTWAGAPAQVLDHEHVELGHRRLPAGELEHRRHAAKCGLKLVGWRQLLPAAS